MTMNGESDFGEDLHSKSQNQMMAYGGTEFGEDVQKLEWIWTGEEKNVQRSIQAVVEIQCDSAPPPPHHLYGISNFLQEVKECEMHRLLLRHFHCLSHTDRAEGRTDYMELETVV
mmetsp:Transcript_17750/g.29187  ORF Transcript_17750/g.29187 Transcript_17750/m.29187 type:complete len:115 (-) Transcript_17750:368-712(-)